MDNLLEKQRAEDERESRNTQTELSSRCQETKDFGSAFGDQFRQVHHTPRVKIVYYPSSFTSFNNEERLI